MKALYSIPMPGKVIVGKKAIKEIPSLISKIPSNKNVLLLTDKGIKESGLLGGILEVIESEAEFLHVLDSVPSEPSLDEVGTLIDEARKQDFSLVIGIGGGSVLDSAKIVAALLVENPSLRELVTGATLQNKGKQTLLIPTTSGTGSEATPNAIVAVPEEKRKVGIVSDVFLPNYVILDPSMTLSLPAKITAATGVDALCHAIECYFSKKANPLSDMLALHSMSLIYHNLETAYTEPDNLTARENMLLASFCAGMCIATSGTTAVHALSYPLGGIYHIPHGVSNAVLLAPVLNFNKDAIVPHLNKIGTVIDMPVKAVSEEKIAEEVIKKTLELIDAVNIPRTLSELGIESPNMEDLVDSASQVTRLLNNNPKTLTKNDIRSIYESIL